MVSRRDLLIAAPLSIAGAAGSVAAYARGLETGTRNLELTQAADKAMASQPAAGLGIECPLHRHITLLALELNRGLTQADVHRWMVLLTDDIQRLTKGEAPAGDPQPELAEGAGQPAIAVGFGPDFFTKLGLSKMVPAGFAQVPPLPIDRLESRFVGGDVLLQVQSNLPIQLAHMVRVLLRDSNEFASIKWQQDGFSQEYKVEGGLSVHRNLMGQVDGTDNPGFGSQDFENLVWIKEGPDWCIGGTQLVVRRIRMKLDTWDSLSAAQKESTIGRKLSNGAPLGATHLTDPVDLAAKLPTGLPVIPDYAHVRRAAGDTFQQRFYRRPYNYTVSPSGNLPEGEAGLLFLAYACDLNAQYLPVQRKLSEFDLLNVWTVPVGSATFVIAPMPKPGDILAAGLFD